MVFVFHSNSRNGTTLYGYWSSFNHNNFTMFASFPGIHDSLFKWIRFFHLEKNEIGLFLLLWLLWFNKIHYNNICEYMRACAVDIFSFFLCWIGMELEVGLGDGCSWILLRSLTENEIVSKAVGINAGHICKGVRTCVHVILVRHDIVSLNWTRSQRPDSKKTNDRTVVTLGEYCCIIK